MTFQIYRDAWGIPHIKASTEAELSFAQGYNAACDRGWQLEVERHRAEGTSASFLGEKFVDWDIFARRLQLNDTARRCFRNLKGETRAWLIEYVRGVNTGLQKQSTTEFEKCNIQPGKWAPWTPISIWLSTHILLGSFPSKLWREEVSKHLGENYINLFSAEGVWSAGSNGWYVSAERTQNNAPILAGDPHRIIELPGCYQQIHLACDDYEVIGFAVPGIPGVQHFGHAGEVAWSITNAMADCQDVFEEKLERREDGIFALGVSGFEPVSSHHETIEIRGQDSLEIEVLETKRGPIIIDEIDEGISLSLRTTARAFEDSGFDAIRALLRAKTVSDIDEACDAWREPVNVVQAADQSGGFIYRVAGAVPQRSSKNYFRIVPAWDIEHQWQGIQQCKKSSTQEDVVVMANQRGLAESYGTEFAPPHRMERILQLLSSKKQFGPKDMTAIHTDTQLDSAKLLIEFVSAQADLEPPLSSIKDQLCRWDLNMDGDSQEAALFASLRTAVVKRLATTSLFTPLGKLIVDDSIYSPLFHPWLCLTTRIGFALESIIKQGIPDVDLSLIVRASLADVAQSKEQWSKGWADLHRVTPWKALESNDDSSWPGIGGDQDTVMSSSSLPGIAHICWRGPVARYVWDLSDISQSLWIVPFGASGHSEDPHYADQYNKWRHGELLPVSTNWQQLQLEQTVITPDETYQKEGVDWGLYTISQIDPIQDAALIYSWVSEERAAFWGMTEYTQEDVKEVYEYLSAMDSHNVFFLKLDEQPIALFQLYMPHEEEMAALYDCQESDIGLHLFVAPTSAPRKGFTNQVLSVITEFVFSKEHISRIVIEPDVRNQKSIARFNQFGFNFSDQISLSHKDAQLMFLERNVV
ncbi:GNAT family N-acetyltransferase [Algicola sagamiensis]|uniref:GNAT family N-acetyltransferase n=1 Tax=Algicola sagamiensis TaxID=163869 RepID=UPI0003750A76|nr:GNAT family N-acetyltransferase [Algicola sagamiensis]